MEVSDLFGMGVPAKWFITYEFKNVIYYLASADDHARQLTWSQQANKAIKFDSSTDAEKVMTLIMSHRKNKKQAFKVR